MGYRRTRTVLILIGLGILGVLAALQLVRSVDEVEVVATLFFLPVFVALLYFGVAGGVAGAAAATAGYVFLRSDAIDAVGWGEFTGLIATRGLSYLLFGAVGGWAAATLEQSLDKLDRHDHVDDLTGVENARALLDRVDLERSRCERYSTLFSVSFVDFPASALAGLPRRRQRTVLRLLGRSVGDAVRSVDRVAHGYDGERHRFSTVLPETAAEGARIFHGRFLQLLRRFFDDHGLAGAERIEGVVVTLPGEEDVLDSHLAVWRSIDSSEHAAERGTPP